MFITFEGIEGSGKSTQLRLAAEALAALGHEVTLTREPGGTELGRELRRILLDARNTHIAPPAELFLYLADRAQHLAEVIRPALARGAIVLCDRFADSTVAYQGHGRGLDPDLLDRLNAAAVEGTWPHLTVLLDLDPEIGLGRARSRNAVADAASDEGRFEALELAFHQRVRQGFLDLAARHPGRFAPVTADGAAEAVHGRVMAAIEARLDAARSGA